jgi:hypothetical protein
MNELMDRRLFLGGLGLIAMTSMAGPATALAPVRKGFVMWHSPGCGCCLEWAKRIEASFGRKLPIIEVDDIARVKRAQGVPDGLESCHTALIHGFVIEGHVPPADIKRLIKGEPNGAGGLAVAGMPAGSPGMDVGHTRKQPYKVYRFDKTGQRRVFASHG